MERSYHEFDNLFTLLDHDTTFQTLWATFLLAVPCLLVLRVC